MSNHRSYIPLLALLALACQKQLPVVDAEPAAGSSATIGGGNNRSGAQQGAAGSSGNAPSTGGRGSASPGAAAAPASGETRVTWALLHGPLIGQQTGDSARLTREMPLKAVAPEGLTVRGFIGRTKLEYDQSFDLVLEVKNTGKRSYSEVDVDLDSIMYLNAAGTALDANEQHFGVRGTAEWNGLEPGATLYFTLPTMRYDDAPMELFDEVASIALTLEAELREEPLPPLNEVARAEAKAYELGPEETLVVTFHNPSNETVELGGDDNYEVLVNASKIPIGFQRMSFENDAKDLPPGATDVYTLTPSYGLFESELEIAGIIFFQQ